MVLKTFSVQEQIYTEFSGYCKENGINMSKQVEIFMQSVIAEEPKAKKEYLDKLERIRKGKFIKVNSLAERYK
ncbi:MAG: hypothetical protein KKG59_06140 [Nanoarchaeota archaeon]|nr:hypothetical protein [Nanoarchaeota archaeon]